LAHFPTAPNEQNLALPWLIIGQFKKLPDTFYPGCLFYYYIFEMLKKKIWASFPRIIELFTQNLSISSHKYGLGIRDPDLDTLGIPDTRSGS
jgi:hypothetical protein